MNFVEVSLDQIDFEDQRFRLSEELDVTEVLESLRQAGQLNPVHLLSGRGSRLVIVCGFRRLRALRTQGHSSALARVWLQDECSDLAAFRLSLWDNLSHRQLNALEKARALTTLKNACGVPHDALVEAYLPALGLAPHKSVLRTYLTLHDLHPGLRRMLLAGRITLTSAEHLCAMPAAFQDTVSSVLQRVHWSASLQREMWRLLEELAVITGTDALQILTRPDITAVLNDSSLSPFQRGERVHALLATLRNPRLSRTENRFAEQRKKLALPSNIRVIPPPFFESAAVRFEFDASSVEEFKDRVQVLQRASNSAALEELLSIVSCRFRIAE